MDDALPVQDTALKYRGAATGFERVAKRGFDAPRDPTLIYIVRKITDTDEDYERRLRERLDWEGRRTNRKWLSDEDRAFLRDMALRRAAKRLDTLHRQYDDAYFDNDLDQAFDALRKLHKFLKDVPQGGESLRFQAQRLVGNMATFPDHGMWSKQREKQDADKERHYGYRWEKWSKYSFTTFTHMAMAVLVTSLPRDMGSLEKIDALIRKWPKDKDGQGFSTYYLSRPDNFFEGRGSYERELNFSPLSYGPPLDVLDWSIASDSPLLYSVLQGVGAEVKRLFEGDRYRYDPAISIGDFNIHSGHNVDMAFPAGLRTRLQAFIASGHAMAQHAEPVLTHMDALLAGQLAQVASNRAKLDAQEQAIKDMWGLGTGP
jgi:hypothetical protein